MTAPAPLSGGDARTPDDIATALWLGARGQLTLDECKSAIAMALADQRARYERIADERAAEALDEAAGELRDIPTKGNDGLRLARAADRIDARAASLRAASRGETGQ